MKHISIFLFLLVIVPQFLMSQDKVLLTIDDQPVYLSEFERIYKKNNNIEGYESKTPAEYLEMFINFKLKVLEARNLGFDTLSSFINELAGYRDQLARPYLQDRKLIDQMVQQAYYRTINEVNASHIMVKIPANPTPKDTLEAYNKALDIRKRIIAGESFEKIAREESDDHAGKLNGGLLGWFSAFTMVYQFENAAYTTKPGDYSLPVRSKYGYHIIKVNAVRPALGELKLAHIMIRTNRNDTPEADARNKEKIDACYKLLQSGSSFSDMVKQYSEDAAAARNGGQMRWLRSGELPPEIEEVVFALKDSGSYTAPIKSEYGWHIFQLLGKRPIAPFEEIKPQLEEKLMMDERGKQTEESFTRTLKKDYGFVSYPENISMIADQMDSTVYAGNWSPANAESLIEPIFKIGNKEYSQKDLVDFIVKTKRFNKRESYQTIVSRKFDEFVFKELMGFEKQQLDEKYPAFKYLMEEYHDGILLFNIMDSKVWSKAVNDSAGLRNFYDQHTGDYMWQERAAISVYTVKKADLIKTTSKLAVKRINKSWPAKEFAKMVCPKDSIPCVEVADRLIERDETQPLSGFTWKKGFVKTMGDQILVVNNILEPSPKSFNETQGQVTADYQNFLDKQWIDSLRAKYKVAVNQDVLQLVK
jgi:peptidyl-prolyl cis-trans isomerase SurA